MYSKNTDTLAAAMTKSTVNNTSKVSDSLETLSLPILSSIQSRLSFLENLLTGKLPVLEIPAAKTRAKIKEFTTTSKSLFLPKVLYASLKNISIKEKVSLDSILLTTLQILLYRYTNQTEIIV
ncbi:MAG: hypothetical protein RLZZ381_2201, partial [Cyanobacteriota bacterium]